MINESISSTNSAVNRSKLAALRRTAQNLGLRIVKDGNGYQFKPDPLRDYNLRSCWCCKLPFMNLVRLSTGKWVYRRWTRCPRGKNALEGGAIDSPPVAAEMAVLQ